MGSLRQAEEVLVLPRLPNMQEIYAAEMRVRWLNVSRATCSHFPIPPFPPPYISSPLPPFPFFHNVPQSHLKPELPEDIALHFYISSSLLILTVFTVTQTPKSGTSVRATISFLLWRKERRHLVPRPQEKWPSEAHVGWAQDKKEGNCHHVIKMCMSPRK